MTDKKENILIAALELFATDGFNATSTSKIAKQAGVSEGLIFRHFEHKKGLLQAIMKDGERKINEIYAHVLFETDPREVIRKTISIPFEIHESEYPYWALQFKLKWEAEYNNPQKMQPLVDKWIWAFSTLNYPNPELEARLLNQLMEAVATGILREGRESQEAYRTFLLEKYLS